MNSNALALKEAGNDLFKAGDYEGAIDKYSDALQISPADPSLYANRAMCYLKLQW